MILSYDQRICMGQYPVVDLLGYRHTENGDLINTFLPIEIISNDLMFYSPSHFIHAFKKYYNITPLQYRQKHSKSDKPTTNTSKEN